MIHPSYEGTNIKELREAFLEEEKIEDNPISHQQFNQMVSTMLMLFAEHIGVPKNEIMTKIMDFNNQLENKLKTLNEKSIQLGQDDQTTN